MRTYICTRCNLRIVVGHPEPLFMRRAKALAKETYSLFRRILNRRKILRRYLLAMVDRFYLEPHRYRSLPDACPGCGCKSRGDMPWWRPGVSFPG